MAHKGCNKPLSSSSSSSDDSSSEDSSGGRGDPKIEASISITSDFVLDFYRCGTDWLCLVVESAAEKEKGGLVQRDLFQMWGIKKPTDGLGFRVSSPSSKRQRRMIGGAGGGDRVDQEVPQLKRKGYDRGFGRPRIHRDFS